MNRFNRITNPLLVITHDLGVIAEMAHMIAVMYAGNDFTSVWFMVYYLHQKMIFRDLK
jgi:ABC-type microcin C transport system duplicated ATPase subunit YejF